MAESFLHNHVGEKVGTIMRGKEIQGKTIVGKVELPVEKTFSSWKVVKMVWLKKVETHMPDIILDGY